MVLKAVLFDFNGVIINDERFHEAAIAEILLEENLMFKPGEFQQFCLGRGDRACLTDLLGSRGRVVMPEVMEKLIQRKAYYYRQKLETLNKLPIYPNLGDLIFKFRMAGLKMAVVSGALRSEIESILDRAQLKQYFSVIVAGNEVNVGKPAADGYLLAVERLNRAHPALALQPSECLAIEDSFPGLEAAKRAGISVVGVAHTYPFHMLQRRANWTIDNLYDLEVDRVQRWFDGCERNSESEKIS
jgi:beta-phosphoglucomutase